MILAIIGAIFLVIALSIFWIGRNDNLELKPVAVLFILAIGASMADPVLIIPIGKFILGLPWIGGA
jgi:hypothetical protein